MPGLRYLLAVSSPIEFKCQVAEVRKIAEHHRALVDDLRRKGLPTAAAEEILRGFERSLAVLEEREKATQAGKVNRHTPNQRGCPYFPDRRCRVLAHQEDPHIVLAAQ